MEKLARACAPATFGRNDEDVLDETYRKAGKLDATDFCVKLDVGASGLLGRVQGQLLEGPSSAKKIRAELSKLNVYGASELHLAYRRPASLTFCRKGIVLQVTQGHSSEKKHVWIPRCLLPHFLSRRGTRLPP